MAALRSSRGALIGALMALAIALSPAMAQVATAADADTQTGYPAEHASGTWVDLTQTGNTEYPEAFSFTLGNLPGQTFVGYCTDLVHYWDDGPNDVATTTTTPVPGTDEAALAWIIANSNLPGATLTPDQVTVNQVAVWALDGELNEVHKLTSDDSLNDKIQALIAEARAATAVAPSLALSVAPPAAGDTTAVVTVTGPAGAQVHLQVTSGAGTLAPAVVTLDAGGTATTTLTTPGAGTVTVSATTTGGHVLNLIRIQPKEAYQSSATATLLPLTATGTVTFTATPPTPPAPPVPPTPPVTPPLPPVTPPTPPVTPPTPAVTPPAGAAQGTPAPTVNRTAVLRISKTGPKRARGLQRVTYRIVVRNSGKAVARNVVLRDRLPKGLAYVRTSTTASFRKGLVTVRLGNLRPGARKIVRVIVKAPSNARGRKTNVASVRATGVRPVRDTARTVFRPLMIRVSPAVTG